MLKEETSRKYRQRPEFSHMMRLYSYNEQNIITQFVLSAVSAMFAAAIVVTEIIYITTS